MAMPTATSPRYNPSHAMLHGIHQNVKAFGATGDGTTDDTAAIQEALNISTLSNPVAVYLPPGTYKITNELVMPFSPGMKLFGAGKRASVLKQFTAGKAILRFDTVDTHSVNVSDMALTYDVPQTNVASVAVKWNARIYFHKYERLHVINAYRGFATNDVVTPWNNTFSDVQLFDIKNRAFSFVSTGGNPVNVMQLVSVINTGGAGVVSTDACITSAGTELCIDGLDIEGWYNTIFDHYGGSITTIRGLHVESHKFDAAFSQLFSVANAGPFRVEGFSVSGATTANNSDTVNIVRASDAAEVALRDGKIAVATALGTSYSRGVVFSPAGGAKAISLDGVRVWSGGLLMPTDPTDADTPAKVLMTGILSDDSKVGLQIADANLYRAAANVLVTDDDFAVAAVGKGLRVKEGTNAKMGTAVLVAGTVVVSTTAVTANSRIFVVSQVDGGTPGFLRVSARTAGTSFTITSSSGTDTSTVAWLILEPA
ncbi:MAG: glycosyl hydrolase family 28-related protein [Nitrospiraceae bacterium]